MTIAEHAVNPVLPVLGMLNSPGGTVGDYLVAARQSGIADSHPEGLALHWSAEVQGGMMGASLWRSRADAEHFFAAALSGAITEIAHQAAVSGDPSTDYRYDFHPVEELCVGPAAPEFAGRGLGEAAGAVLVRGIDAGSAETADGLVMRARLASPGGEPVFSLWSSQTAATTGDADEVFALHTLLTVPAVLEQL